MSHSRNRPSCVSPEKEVLLNSNANSNPIMRKFFFTAVAAVMCLGCSADESQLKLWYDAPARQWTDALPLGNGRLGVMVFGTPAQERIQINEETIWGGGPHNNVNYTFCITVT